MGCRKNLFGSRNLSISWPISSKSKEAVSYYEILGVQENANGLEIEDAFVEKLGSPEYTVNPMDASNSNEETLEKTLELYEAYQTLTHPSKRIDYDVKLRMIRRGEDPDRPKEKRIKTGAFIKVEKEEIKKTKISVSEAADNLMQNNNDTPVFMKTDFKHKVSMQELSEKAKQRRSEFGLDMGDLKIREREAKAAYGQVHRYTSLSLGVCCIVFGILYYFKREERKTKVDAELTDYMNRTQ